MAAIVARDWPSIEDWLKDNPCPQTGSGLQLVDKWLLRAANAADWIGLSAEEAFPFIASACTKEICGRVVSAAAINRAINKAYNASRSTGNYGTKAVPVYDSDLLSTVACKVDFEVTDYWLAEVSPECVLDVSPAAFLSQVFECGETVFITDKFKAKGGSFYLHDGCASGLDCLDDFIHGHQNVWFLSNPVDGLCHNDSIRSEANITSFRYGVLESDRAPADLWLRMLIQLHLPIVSICTSGGKSVHALFRVDASSKAEWDQIVRFGQTSVLSQLVPVGADPGALSAVRLTRLPGCIREETGKEQKLLYLNPAADERPIWRSKGN